MNPIRLMLADDHRMLREGLRRSMTEEGFDVVGEAHDGVEAVRLAEELLPGRDPDGRVDAELRRRGGLPPGQVARQANRESSC